VNFAGHNAGLNLTDRSGNQRAYGTPPCAELTMPQFESTKSDNADAAARAVESRHEDTSLNPIHRIGARFPLRLLHSSARRLRAPHRIATAAHYRGMREAI
jgi:hypothetical protein